MFDSGGMELMRAYCIHDEPPVTELEMPETWEGSENPGELPPDLTAEENSDVEEMGDLSDMDPEELDPTVTADSPEEGFMPSDELDEELPGPADEPLVTSEAPPEEMPIESAPTDPVDETPEPTDVDPTSPIAGPDQGSLEERLMDTLEKLLSLLKDLVNLIKDIRAESTPGSGVEPAPGGMTPEPTPEPIPEPTPPEDSDTTYGGESDDHGCSGDHAPDGEEPPVFIDETPDDSLPNEPDLDVDPSDEMPQDQDSDVDLGFGPPLENSIMGGTGEAQKDMDPTKDGVQINVVLEHDMSASDRSNTEEALANWEEASKGELDFLIFDEDQQPVGQDYIYIESVAQDNTNVAGEADIGRSPDGVTQAQFETDSGIDIIMHEIGHTLGLEHGNGVMKAVNPTETLSDQNLADLVSLYPGANVA